MRIAFALSVAVIAVGCGDEGTDGGGASAATGGTNSMSASTSTSVGGSTGDGHFTYGFQDRVYRIEARVGATPEDVSAALEAFTTADNPARDRWLVPSHSGAHLVLSTDRLTCSLGECLAIAPSDLSSLALVRPDDQDVSLEGTPAINDAGDTIVYSTTGGPHASDLYLIRRTGPGWGAPVLLTGDSSFEFNNMPAMTFDETRVLFDCGSTRDPEDTDTTTASCEVALDGSGFRVLVDANALADGVNDFVQFPHDSLDGVLFQGSWPIDDISPEAIWLLLANGTPTPIGKAFTNSVSPCGLPDGRFGILWLEGPGNEAGAHELTLVARDGTLIGVLTPGVDVSDIGIGCSN